jgi:nucleoside phosphorylase
MPAIKPSLAILTALPKEHGAVQRLLTQPSRHHVEGDPTIYTLGLIAGPEGNHSVVHACLSKYANNPAAVTATNILRSFPSVREILLVGIAAGIPRPDRPDAHVRLGDVVVSSGTGIIQFDMGAATSRGFEVRSTAPPPSARLLQAVNMLESEILTGRFSWREFVSKFVKKARSPRPCRELKHNFDHPPDGARERGVPRIFRGKIGASNTLMKNAKKRDAIAKKFGLLALEMEGSGVADSTWEHGVGYLVIRGICDYADAQKNDTWQSYAAHIAAAYLGSLLLQLPTISISRPSITDSMQRVRTPDFSFYISRTKPIRNMNLFWRFQDPRRIVVVSGAIHGVARPVKAVVLAGPDADAANSLVASAALLYPKAEIQHVYSSSFPPELYKENLVVVGGPVNNKCAAAVLEKVKEHILFKNTFDLFVSGTTYETIYDDSGRPVRDHGAVVRVANPFDKSKDIILIVGCDTYGVLAASMTITPKSEAASARNDLLARIRSRKRSVPSNYIAVVECDILGNDVGNVRLRAFREID